MYHGAATSLLDGWTAVRFSNKYLVGIVGVTVDLMRPVPLVPLTLETEVLRQGRKIQLCTVRLKADGVLVAAANVLKVRCGQERLPPIPETRVELPGPEQSLAASGNFSGSPFVDGMSLRPARSRLGVAGPAAVWFRIERPLVEGSPVSQAMRAVVASDFANGTAPLDFREWTFLNADLTVSMAREPRGDWILLDGESWIGPDGSGLSMARLADERGYFGRAAQSLVIERRRRRKDGGAAAVS